MSNGALVNGKDDKEPNLSLAAQMEEAVAEYVRIAPPPGDTASIDPDVLNKSIMRLDAAYWKKVDEVIGERLAAADPANATLPFAEDDRLLLDFGLLDERLLGVQSPGIRKRLLAERSQTRPANVNILYLSEWIERRYQYHLTIEELDKERWISKYIHSAPEISAMVERRERILSLLRPYMRHLPGVNELLSQFISEGRLDDLVFRLIMERMRAPRAGIEGRLMRIEGAFRYVMRKVAERAPENKFLQLIDEYNSLRLEIFRHVNRMPKEVIDRSEQGLEMAAVAAKVQGEVKLIRTLMNLGTLSGAITRPHAVLLRDTARATVEGVQRVMALIAEVDASLSLDRNVLIAPFTGNGFFEWDQDTLVVSLIPVRTVDEDVVTAVASMRMVLDKFEHGEELKSVYEKLYPGKDFRETFTRDYVAWVLKVGRGQKQQMDPKAFEVFMKYIGHNGVDPVIPAELAHTTAAERDRLLAMIVEKIHGGNACARDLFLAAVIRWQRGDHQTASRYLESAAKLAPDDGRVLYSLGILLRNMHMKGPAKKRLVQCTRVAPQTIWQVYAFEALRKLGW